jgi:hypothetical protein
MFPVVPHTYSYLHIMYMHKYVMNLILLMFIMIDKSNPFIKNIIFSEYGSCSGLLHFHRI